jgi:hypothetical protein
MFQFSAVQQQDKMPFLAGAISGIQVFFVKPRKAHKVWTREVTCTVNARCGCGNTCATMRNVKEGTERGTKRTRKNVGHIARLGIAQTHHCRVLES